MSGVDDIESRLMQLGVEYERAGAYICWKTNKEEYEAINCFNAENQRLVNLGRCKMTAEQAIEATLGRGTCEICPHYVAKEEA